MKHTTIQMIRAHLVTASVAATAIDVCVMSLLFFRSIPQTMFETATFRVLTIGLLLAAIMITRHAARIAFRAAVKRRHAHFIGPRREAVCVSALCPARPLVILHLHFNGMSHVPVHAAGW